MTSPPRSILQLLKTFFVCTAAACAAVMWGAAAAAIEIDDVMLVDPELPVAPHLIRFSPDYKSLWLQALAGPEADLRRQVATAIARVHENKLADMSDCAGPLLKALERKDEQPEAAHGIVRALIAIDARQSADRLAKLLPTASTETALYIEPALARWDYAPIRGEWLQRLKERTSSRKRLLLAIRGLAEVGETRAAPLLQKLAGNRDEPATVRLEAAQSLAAVQPDGLVEFAREMAGPALQAPLTDRLVAASVLDKHTGDAAVKLLVELSQDEAPTVAAIALRRLIQIDPELIAPLGRRLAVNPDANVRQLAAEALVARPNLEAVKILGPLLDDPHPDVRRYVATSFVELAEQQALHDAIIDEGVAMLATDHWRGLEQATLLLGSLDHKPAANRFVELLTFDRPEVTVASAWGLRKLAIPETFPAMLEHAERQAKVVIGAGYTHAGDKQLRQLFQAFGTEQYAPSDPLLRQFIPKGDYYGYYCRPAAFWALGKVHTDAATPELTNLFVERLSDLAPLMPELPDERRMAAVSLGRMKAEDALPDLRRFYKMDGPDTIIGQACGWAIQQMTGEVPAKPRTSYSDSGGWFLMPAGTKAGGILGR